MTEPLIEVRNLTKHFPQRTGFFGKPNSFVHAVDDVSFQIMPGETVALVGESGCGKSTTGRLVLNLIRPTSGEVRFHGKNIFEQPPEHMRAMRQHMQIVFQDPYSSLNPRMSIGEILEEGLLVHTQLSPEERHHRIAEILDTVGLPTHAITRYPHEFSGGQRQRIAIARAISVNPEFIVCDEAVSSLDVSIQAQVLNLLSDLQQRLNMAYLFITHDLSVVRHLADRVIVMYLGHMVESAPTESLFEKPHHPYTRALLSAIPTPNPENKRERMILSGDLPSPVNPPQGCRFHTRCPFATDACKHAAIPDRPRQDEGTYRCILDV